MTENQEVETACRLWKILFDHYGEALMDIFVDDQVEKAKELQEVDWPF